MAAMSLLLALTLHLLAVSGQPLSSASLRNSTRSRPTARLDTGVVAGTSSGAVNRFLGIPFAAPPVRFEPPQPAKDWSEVYDASAHKPSCIQKFNDPPEWRDFAKMLFNTPPPPGGESEDCLYLNVWAPAGTVNGSSKTVLFWLYGGSFSFGSASIGLYDGSSFAANQDVIVVAPNYRTNVFGFPGSPEKPESEQNLGLLDQRLALDWVQRNIGAFGGDLSRVTLFGESAGAISVDLLVTSPPKPVPFAGAILQSGQTSVRLRGSANKSGASWKTLADAADCPPDGALECIRALPAEKLRNIVERRKLEFQPIDDITSNPSPRADRRQSIADASRIARVPILIGSTADEGSVFVRAAGTSLQDQLKRLLPGELVNTISGTNASSNSNGVRSPGLIKQQASTLLTDLLATCTVKILSEESVGAGISTWRYFFDAGFPNDKFPGSGAWHLSEIGLVHGTYELNGATAYQAALSQAMQKAWAEFAKHPSEGPGWEAAPRVGFFGAGVRAGDDVPADTPTRTVGDADRIDKNYWLYSALYKPA